MLHLRFGKSFNEMISAQNVKNNSYVILGLGRSGLSVAAALKAGGAKVLCLDDNPKYLKKAEELGLSLIHI